MDADWVKEDETLEDLQLKGLKVIQKKDGFRFGMDSVLLAHFARIGERDHVADFGTGSGVIPLLLIGRNKGRTFECFEIQEEIAEMAERMIEANRQGDLDALASAHAENDREAVAAINAKYNERLRLYREGLRQWDTSVSVTMIVRGEK